MAKYDRLKKCKCNGCPLSVDVVTLRDGNGVCDFHDAATAKDWMIVRDRIVEHKDFLLIAQSISRLGLRYKPMTHEFVYAWIARVTKDLRVYILNIDNGANAVNSMIGIKNMLRLNNG